MKKVDFKMIKEQKFEDLDTKTYFNELDSKEARESVEFYKNNQKFWKEMYKLDIRFWKQMFFCAITAFIVVTIICLTVIICL